MRNFTKLFLGLALALGATTANAQIDVACTAVTSPVAGSTVYENSPSVALDFTIENMGAAIPAGSTDTIFIDVTVNGTFLAAFTRDPANAFAAGASEPLTVGNLNLANIPGLATGPVEVCVSSRVAADNNLANDTSCSSFTYATALAADLGVTDVVVVAPAPTQGNLLNLGASISELNVIITNHGATTVPAGFQIPYTISQGSQSFNLIGTLATDLTQGQTTTRVITNPAVLPTLPTVEGDFDICVETTLTGDPDASNNSFCKTFKMNDPSTPPLSVEEAAIALDKVFYNGGNLNVNLTNNGEFNQINFVVSNLAGQQVVNQVVNLAGQKEVNRVINLNNAAQGTYILGVYSEGQLVSTSKFFVN